VLALFRANTFFRNFEIKGPADRVLIYGILFTQEVLGKVKSGKFCWFFFGRARTFARSSLFSLLAFINE
jgi:hypothetical protein